ncbi:hypothetical protein D3C78_1826390 [compost metagenome]
MRVVQRPQGMGQGVHGTQAALEGGGTHGGRHEHLLARLHIRAVRHHLRQVFLDHPHAFDGDARGHRMKKRRAIRLKVVR